MMGTVRIGANALRRVACAGFLVAAAAITVATPAASASTQLAAREVFGTVKSVNTVTNTVVLWHFKTARAVSSPTLTFSLAGTKISAPNKWVLRDDKLLLSQLNSKLAHKLLASNPIATALYLTLENPITHVIPHAYVWTNALQTGLTASYLQPGDTVYGFSALSEAGTAHYELTHKTIPLATLQDAMGHKPCYSPSNPLACLGVARPAQTPAEVLQLFLGSIEAGLG